MAKDIVQQFKIEAGKAVSALDQVTGGLKKYNTVVKDGTKIQADSNIHNDKARTNLRELAKAVDQTATRMSKLDTQIRNLRDATRASATQYNSMAKAMANMVQSGRDANRMLHSLGTSAGNTATEINQLKTAVVSHTGLLRQETTHLQYNVVALRELGTAVRKVVGDMGLKNRTIDQQVQANIRDQHATQDLTQTYRVLSAIIISLFVHRAISEMIRGMQEATTQAQELQVRLGEIATLSLAQMEDGTFRVTKSTGEWTKELLTLQRAYGFDVIDLARAAYEALSSQVVNAGNATQFLASQAKLAQTAVSSLEEAVDVTTNIINAYNLKVDDAAAINATLFAAVDIGNFRLADLGNSFARSNVLAAQLGISYQEVAGALSLISRNGLDAESSSTLLLNVFNGLVKPTEELNDFFRELGLQNAETALKTLGFTGVMQLLAREVDNGNGKLSQMAVFFDDIRGLVGASGLTKAFAQLGLDIDRVSNATERYNAANEEVLKNLGTRGKIELEKFKQYFLNEFGLPIQEAMTQFAESVGGADKGVARLAYTLGLLTAAGVTFYGSQRVLIPFLQGLGVQFLLTSRQAAAYDKQLLALQLRQAVVSFGVTAIAGALVYLATKEAYAAQEARLLAQEIDANIFQENQKHIEAYTVALDRLQQQIASNNPTRAYFQAFQGIRQVNQAILADYDATYKKITKIIEDSFKTAIDNIEAGIERTKQQISDLQRDIEQREQKLLRFRLNAADQGVQAKLVGKSDVDAARILIEERNKLYVLANQALAQNNENLAEEFFDRVDKLHQEAVRRIIQAKEEAERQINQGNINVNNQGGFNVRLGNFRAQQAAPRAPGRAPPVRVAVNQPIAGPQNPQLAADLAQQLNNLEQQRLQFVQARVAAEQQAIAAQKQQKEELEKQLKTQQAALTNLKDVVSRIDAFKETGDPKELSKLIGQAERIGAAAGLDPKELFNLLRDARALYLKSLEVQEVKASEERLTQLQKELETQNKLEQQALQKRKEAQLQAQKDIGEVIRQNLASLPELENVIKNLTPILKHVHPKGIDQPQLLAAAEATRKSGIPAQKELQLLQNQLVLLKQKSELLSEARRNEDAKGQVAALAEIDKIQKSIIASIAKLDKLGVKTSSLFDFGQNNKKELGGGKLPERPGAAQETVKQRIEDLNKLNQEVLKNIQAAQQSSKLEAAAITAQRQLGAELNNVAKAHAEITKNAGLSGQSAIDAYQRANAVLEQTKQRLQEINALLGQQVGGQQLAHGGEVNFRAGGGRGTDRIAAFLTRGEFVSDRLATRQYEPILAALNRAPPQYRSSGGTTINMGDTHIHASPGTTEQQAAEIGRHLQRRVRRGLYKG